MELRGVFILAMIACCHYLAFPADGRPIKSTGDPKQSSQTEESAMHENGHEPAAVEGGGRPSFAGPRPGRKQVLPPPMPSKSSGSSVSVDGYKDAFRPTTPGNSPGAGHSFGEDDEETEQKPVGRASSNNGDKEGFRPTNPGHSPGGGHAFVTKKSKPNA
ncbi:Detected protein of unknown function [Hibiscus syriacus]|uniref:Uncharacterized protein n=1 Tax=Hibiscus syriacus TaxID=106335 RepID=A0A6A3A9V1_HIBSY|nr:precursor of CEP9-like [Hibiscus syriacus]KAE8701210.1 Detected protein of unknown function [Hibiscus syriacus]